MAARGLITGRRGEEAAARHLAGIGYEILHRNWRHGRFELDIVCRDKDTLVFVEVKTRGEHGMTTPAEGLDKRKLCALVRAAGYYLSAHGLWDRPCRFDLVSVYKLENNFRLEHLPNAFDLSQALGGGHPDWQPW